MNALVVVPCLNEAAHLPTLLAQLARDPAAGLIVVADGGSSDGSREIVARAGKADRRIVLLDNPDRLQGAGINRAVAVHGEGRRWLVRVDAHCSYPDDYVATLTATAEARGAGAVVVPMVTHGSGCFQRAAAAAQNSVVGTGGSAHRHLGEGRFVDHGHHALIALDAFRRAGGYCEAMACNEDAELDHRLGAGGTRIWLEPAAAIGYFPRRDPVALWRQYRRYGEGRARNVARHKMPLKPRQALPLLVLPALLLALLAPLHPVFAAPAALWAGAVLIAGLVVGARAGGGCALLAGVAALIMHAAWSAGYWAERLRHPSGVPPRHGLAEAGR